MVSQTQLAGAVQAPARARARFTHHACIAWACRSCTTSYVSIISTARWFTTVCRLCRHSLFSCTDAPTARSARPARNRVPIGFVGGSYHGDIETQCCLPPHAFATTVGPAEPATAGPQRVPQRSLTDSLHESWLHGETGIQLEVLYCHHVICAMPSRYGIIIMKRSPRARKCCSAAAYYDSA